VIILRSLRSGRLRWLRAVDTSSLLLFDIGET
jgi:hypothetical protein